MVVVPEHAHRARFGLLVFVLGFAFVLVAPVGLFAVPLTALLLVSPDRTASIVIATSFAGGIGFWWLWSVGDPAEQLVRAGCIITTVMYVVLSMTTKWTVIHRALASVFVAGMAAVTAVQILGARWAEIIWWIEHRAVEQTYIMQLWVAGQSGSAGFFGSPQSSAAEMENMIRALPDFMINMFPATFALQAIAGVSLATYLVGRIGIRVPGAPMRPFEEFKFSEHLGWPVVFALAIALLVETPALRIPAVNVLMLAGVLYGLRGVAITLFYWRRRSGSRVLLGTLAVLAAVFLWRVTMPAVIILGLFDTGLDLRQRMQQNKVS